MECAPSHLHFEAVELAKLLCLGGDLRRQLARGTERQHANLARGNRLVYQPLDRRYEECQRLACAQQWLPVGCCRP